MPGSSVKAGLPQSGADMTRESMFETFKHQGSDDLRNAWESQLDADISVAARNSAPVLITAPSQAADAIVRAITTRQQDPPPHILTFEAGTGEDVIAALAESKREAAWRGSAVFWMKEVH